MFGEGVCSLKMFNPQAEGSRQMCVILSAELTRLLERICQMFPSLQLYTKC